MLACCGAWSSRERAQRVQPDHLELDLRLGRAGRGAPGRRRCRWRGRASSSASSSRWKPTCWPIVEMPRSKPSVPIATCQPSPSLADDEVGVGAGAGEEHLVELRGAGELVDRPDLDALLVHRHQQVGQAAVALRAGLGAGDHEAPVGLVGQRGPHLLPVDHPVGRPSSAGLGRDRRPGRSRRRARSSPGTRAPRRPRSSAGTAAAAPRCRRRSGSGRAAPRRGGSRGPGRWPARTPRGRSPAGTAAARGRRAPRASRCRSSRASRGAGPTRSRSSWASCSRPGPPLPAQLGEVAGEVLLQPRTDLGAERLVLRAVGQIHADRVAYQALVWFLQARPRSRRSARPSRARVRARCPACCGPLPRRYGDRAAYVEGDRTLTFTRPARRRSAPSPAATWRSASSPVTASWSGRPTASTGWSPASPSRTPAACWCRPTAATPGTRWPTSSTAPARASCVVADGFLGRTQIADLQAASDLASGARGRRPRQPRLGEPARRRARLADEVEARADAVSPDDVADILFTSGTTGRPKGAMSAHRQTIGVADAWGEPRRGHRGGPLPRGEPVLPLLRLQDRHRRRAADRRHPLPRRQLRPRRDDAADPGRPDHGAARRPDDLPVAAHRTEPLRATTCPRCASPSPAPPWCPSS